jgi:hypothetical protein
MNRYHVPNLPEVPPATPEPDPLLEKFRADTIKGKKVVASPRRRGDSASGLDILIDLELDQFPPL